MSGSIWAPGSTTAVSSASTVIPQQFTATDGQTVFALTAFSYTPNSNSILIWVNGVLQISGVDYTESSTTGFTLTTGATLGDKVTAIGLTAISGTSGGYTFVDATGSFMSTGFTAIPASAGAGIVMDYGSLASTGRIVAYDFATTLYKTLYIDGLTLNINTLSGGSVVFGGDISTLGSKLNNSKNLTCYLLPSAVGGWRDIYRAGFWHSFFNQQWGGPFGGELIDAATGTLRKVEFATAYLENDTTDNVANSAANTYKSQGFKVSEALSCPAVWLKLGGRGQGGTYGNFQVFIYSDDGTGKPNALISNGTATAQAGQRVVQDQSGGDWYRFVFATPPALSANTQYHIVAKSSAAVDATFYWCWSRQALTAKRYPHGNKCTGDAVPAWTASTAEAMAFGVEQSSTTALLQSGGVHDGKLSFIEGAPMNQSRVLNSQVRLGDMMEPTENTGWIIGTALTKDKTVVDIGYGEDHDRIVIRSDVTTGFASLNVYFGDFPAVAPVTVTSAVDISTGNHAVGWYVRAKGDGADRIDLFVDGVTVSSTGLTKTFSDEFRQCGTFWLGGGFALAPTWTGSSINSMTALPSTLGWLYDGTATEANAFSVSGGKLFQSYGGVGSAQYASYRLNALGLVNATGSAVVTKMRINFATNTKAQDCPTVGLWDGTKASRFYPKDYYVELPDGTIASYPQVENKGAEATYVHSIKGTVGFLFRNRKLIADETNVLVATAANQINFGDTTNTASENTAVTWSYMKYVATGPVFPQVTSGSISEVAVWSGNFKALWPSLYNAGAFVSVKSFCGLQENYVRREWPVTYVKGVTASPSTASTSAVQLTDMEAFVVGESFQIAFDGAFYNNNLSAGTNFSLHLDGYTDSVAAQYANENVVNNVFPVSVAADMRSAGFGLHKADVRFYVTAGTTQNFTTRRQMSVKGAA